MHTHTLSKTGEWGKLQIQMLHHVNILVCEWQFFLRCTQYLLQNSTLFERATQFTTVPQEFYLLFSFYRFIPA